ncbi:MAG: redoxin domain-containing protein [Chitinophagaceae bacterium]|nr:MAG: redoxin domain-containing protein [Chitinophagaceae bacterium]
MDAGYILILSVIISAVATGQAVIRPTGICDTALLRNLHLPASGSSVQPVLSGHLPLDLLIFLSPECPLSINYTKTLNELADGFSGRVNFIGIVPGKSYSMQQVDSFVHEYKLGFRVYIDPEKKITETVKATVTPEVVLFRNDGRIVYRGAIDDWAVSPGKNKLKANNHYLLKAIEATLSDKNAIIRNTKPVGCLVNNY